MISRGSTAARVIDKPLPSSPHRRLETSQKSTVFESVLQPRSTTRLRSQSLEQLASGRNRYGGVGDVDVRSGRTTKVITRAQRIRTSQAKQGRDGLPARALPARLDAFRLKWREALTLARLILLSPSGRRRPSRALGTAAAGRHGCESCFCRTCVRVPRRQTCIAKHVPMPRKATSLTSRELTDAS